MQAKTTKILIKILFHALGLVYSQIKVLVESQHIGT